MLATGTSAGLDAMRGLAINLQQQSGLLAVLTLTLVVGIVLAVVSWVRGGS